MVVCNNSKPYSSLEYRTVAPPLSAAAEEPKKAAKCSDDER
jgi:hypothetical protein